MNPDNFKKMIEIKLHSSNIPIRFKNEILKLYPDKFKKIQIPKNKGVFIYGPAGTGKTLKAISLVLDNYDTPKAMQQSFVFGNVNEILFQIKQTYRSDFNPNNEVFENELTAEECIIRKYTMPAFLILDDLGVEKTTEFTNQTLYLIINRRYENEKVTFVTSNFSPEELEKKMEDNRIISRLMADCVPIEMLKSHRNK